MRRNQLLRIVAAVAVLVLSYGSRAVSSPGLDPPVREQEPARIIGSTGFVDRVWRVADSPQVEIGSLRVFLSDGTLVMADPHAEPALGTWAMDAGRLTITEEDLTYPVEIRELSEQAFRIRIHGPGEPVDIRFEPAAKEAELHDAARDWVELTSEGAATRPTMQIVGTIRHRDVEGGVWVIRSDEGTFQPTNLPRRFHVDGIAVEAEAVRRDDLVSIGMVGPLVELLRIRRQAAESAPPDGSHELWGTGWILENLAGDGVLDGVQATLELPEAGRVAGNASCNRFFGSVEVSADSLSFGALGTTRRSCTEAVNEQERRYLAALESAERFAIEEAYLLIYSGNLTEPLRLIRMDP